MYTQLGTPDMPEPPLSASTWTSTMGLIASQSEAASTYTANGDSNDGRRVSLLGVVPMFMMTFAAFVLLTLTTFSLPFISGLYFLWSSQAGGVRFGIWGWCLEEGSVCSEKLGMGYTWEPEVAIPITKALALYPVAAISVFMMLVAFIPVVRDKSGRTLRTFAIFAWASFGLAFVVFVFMIAMWSVADERFKAAGWKVHWGPLPWMSFIATVILLIVALNTWKGALAPASRSSYQDSPLSAEGRITAAEADQRLDLDREKALNSPYAPSSPRFKNDSSPVAVSSRPSASTRKEDPKADYLLSSRTTDDLGRSASHRFRQDSLFAAKKRLSGRSSLESPLHASPADMTIAPPPRALRRESVKFIAQLTPLQT